MKKQELREISQLFPQVTEHIRTEAGFELRLLCFLGL